MAIKRFKIFVTVNGQDDNYLVHSETPDQAREKEKAYYRAAFGKDAQIIIRKVKVAK